MSFSQIRINRERADDLQKRLKDLYLELLAAYGHQGWWPAGSPYEVMVGAVLTQNTNWRNVEKAVANLKAADCLSPSAMLATRKARLEALIRPSGFYRQKAERLKRATETWTEINRRKSRLDTIALRSRWLSVKGVGKETADSILLYAYGRPVFVVDAYTRLFCSHHDLFEAKEYDEYRHFFESNIPGSVPLFKEYHALIVQWAKQNKRKKS